MLKIHMFTIAWSPIPEPSCLHTTTYSHPHCLLICHRLLLENHLILCTWQRVLSLLHPRGQEEGAPVWRRLVSHTRLVIVLSAFKWSWTDTDQPRLRLQIIIINKIYNKLQNMQNRPCFLGVLLQHRNIGTLTELHAYVCLCMDSEQ